jgi:hypothetical protein
MLGLESGRRGSRLETWGDELRGRTGLARRTDQGGSTTGLLITGALVVGLGYLMWTYLGPDLKRYLKIHSM